MMCLVFSLSIGDKFGKIITQNKGFYFGKRIKTATIITIITFKGMGVKNGQKSASRAVIELNGS